MPYGRVTVTQSDGRILIAIDPPEQGELSVSGRAENLVDPTRWHSYETADEHLALKMTVCRPRYRRRNSQPK